MRIAPTFSMIFTADSRWSSKGIAIKRTRLDTELLRLGLVHSRTEARRAIEEGLVVVTGVPTPKPATLVDPGAGISLKAPPRFVSRGGDKLDGAIADLDIEVSDRIWLDAGASTGGFTDRLLQGGARAVVAVDVGYGQFHWRLRNDERVHLMERTNVRDLANVGLPVTADAVVADLSFISLRVVLPALVGVASAEADHLLLVKPQFEVGKEAVGKGGVVRDPALWASAAAGVVETAERLGLGLVGAAASRVPGPAGNREFFVHLRKGEDSRMELIEEAIKDASG